MNYVIAISCKGKEFLYRRNTAILIGKNKTRAIEVAELMNADNEKSFGEFKLKEGEIWHVHEDIDALYKLKSTRGKISVRYNY